MQRNQCFRLRTLNSVCISKIWLGLYIPLRTNISTDFPFFYFLLLSASFSATPNQNEMLGKYTQEGTKVGSVCFWYSQQMSCWKCCLHRNFREVKEPYDLLFCFSPGGPFGYSNGIRQFSLRVLWTLGILEDYVQF